MREPEATEYPKDFDVFKDSSIRYLGYANEVGEAFRSLVHVNVVRISYVVASSYVVADAVHKGHLAHQKFDGHMHHKRLVVQGAADALVWQGLASVVIPGFTINRLCWLNNQVLSTIPSLLGPVRKWVTTAVGLCAIPFIISPIDRSVDWMMNSTVRRWFEIDREGCDASHITHHRRND